MFRLVVVILVLCPSALARADGCNQIFAGGQPPVLINAKLAQRTTMLCNDAFAVLASGVTRGPLWSAEHLTANGLASARNTARQGQFHDDERLPPDDRAVLSDYVRSGFDRGHMTPSGDMPDPEAQQQSFSLANVVPQTAPLNREVWEGIESAVRHLAQRRGELFVVTGPIFTGSELQSLKGRVLVPTVTWKAVYDPTARGRLAYLSGQVAVTPGGGDIPEDIAGQAKLAAASLAAALKDLEATAHDIVMLRVYVVNATSEAFGQAVTPLRELLGDAMPKHHDDWRPGAL